MSPNLHKSPLILPKGKDMHGVLHYFYQNSIDPLNTFPKIDASGSWDNDDPKSIIKWHVNDAAEGWASNNIKGAWFSLSFGINLMKLTHFSFKGEVGYAFATKFELYGLRDGEEILKRPPGAAARTLHTLKDGLWPLKL